MDINWLDLGFALVLLLFTLRGLLRGMVKEVAGLISVVLGFFLASRYYPQVSPYFIQWIDDPQWRTYLAYGLIFLAVVVVVAIIAVAVQKFMIMTFISWLDHAVGAATGLIKGALFCAIAVELMQRVDPNSTLLKTSKISPYLDQITAIAITFVPQFTK